MPGVGFVTVSDLRSIMPANYVHSFVPENAGQDAGQPLHADTKGIRTLRPYDTGKIKRYEVPARGTEEVSLTSPTGRSRSKKTGN
jgi:hypothetical protein